MSAKVGDEAYAAFVSELLGTWMPRAMTCGLNGKLISGEASRQNSPRRTGRQASVTSSGDSERPRMVCTQSPTRLSKTAAH